jgi:hypothetical protein
MRLTHRRDFATLQDDRYVRGYLARATPRIAKES